MFRRYAIYAAPRPGPLADFTARWLGWDPAAGRNMPHPDLPGLPQPAEALTRTPRKYGFHGTLKPPFHLARGRSAGELGEAVAKLARAHSPVLVAPMRLAGLGGFVGLVPENDPAALASLAAACVRDLDDFRAPATEIEVARRDPERLSPPQREMLDRWGYPYVFDEFRFHMTLTGKIPEAETAQVIAALRPSFDRLLPAGQMAVADLVLFGEASDGRFHILHRYPLAG